MDLSDQSYTNDYYYCLKNKRTGGFAQAYNFTISTCKNANKNWMVVVFADGSMHDAICSANRHCYPDDWTKEWELVQVSIQEIKE